MFPKATYIAYCAVDWSQAELEEKLPSEWVDTLTVYLLKHHQCSHFIVNPGRGVNAHVYVNSQYLAYVHMRDEFMDIAVTSRERGRPPKQVSIRRVDSMKKILHDFLSDLPSGRLTLVRVGDPPNPQRGAGMHVRKIWSITAADIHAPVDEPNQEGLKEMYDYILHTHLASYCKKRVWAASDSRH